MSNPPERCYIMAGGELGAPLALYRRYLEGKRPIYAADAGAGYLLDMGLIPDAVIGDFDSIRKQDYKKLQNENVPLIRYPRQKDQTDLELVALSVQNEGWNEVYIMGAWGGRIDQSLAALLVLSGLYRHGCKGLLLTSTERVEITETEIIIEGAKGERLSLIPWQGEAIGLTIEGCAYNVQKTNLLPWQTIGISNTVTADRARIHLEQGQLLVIRSFLSPFGIKEQ